MAVRQLDGSTDDIQVAIGALSGMTHGTVATIVKRTALVGFDALFVAHTSGGTRRLQVSFVGNDTNWYPGTGPTDSRGPLVNNTVDWWLIVARKATGTSIPRYSVYNFGSDIWVHANGANALPDSATPGAGGTVRFTMQGGEHLPALLAIRAAWSNALPWSADAAGDTAIEAAGLETAAANWQAASPDAGWLFNQAATSTPVPDFTGGGADQTAITGTTVVVGDDPPGFDFSLSAGTVGSGVGFGGAFGRAAPAKLGTGSAAGFAGGFSIASPAKVGPGTAPVAGGGSSQARVTTIRQTHATGAGGGLGSGRASRLARGSATGSGGGFGAHRPTIQTIVRPFTGTAVRPDSGTTARPSTGIVARP